jgi:hypothetical protein
MKVEKANDNAHALSGALQRAIEKINHSRVTLRRRGLVCMRSIHETGNPAEA